MSEKIREDRALIYEGSIGWLNETGRALLLACSDGRFRDAREEFLRHYCQVQRADAILFPGGPASLLINAPWFFALRPQVLFLHKLHDVQRIIAVTHDDCGYYATKYPRLEVEKRRAQQIADLYEFREEMRKLVPGVAIELYYEQPVNGAVQYDAVS
jgi:Putative carbonic anhydrase